MALLERTVSEGRPAHAYLFSGMEGVGKNLAAIRFAAMLNCPGPPHESPDACSVCRRILTGKHPDFGIERPMRGSIRIDRVREIQSGFQFAPIEGRYRVCVIDDAHSMTRAAQNALLKTLEEPPPQRVIILVTAKPFLLLPTVRSRCRRIRFGPLSAAAVAAILTERGVLRATADVLGRVSSGSLSQAIEMNRPSFIALREKVIGMLTEPSAGGISSVLQTAAEWSKDRQTALDALGIAAAWFRDLLLAAQGPEQGRWIINVDFLDRIAAEAQHYASGQIMAAYDEVTRATDLVQAEFNPNQNLVLDVALLRIARIMASARTGSRAGDA